MNLIKTEEQITYKRQIESMGEGLVLVEISAENKTVGQKYHLFYENGKKPPLDIAINPSNNTVAYISFFVQDEKIEKKQLSYDIFYIGLSVEIYCSNSNENHVQEFFLKDFYMNFSNDDLFVMDIEEIKDLVGYQLDPNNFIIFDKARLFRGIVMKNITKNEMEQFKESSVV